ncbi:class I SAM-dependent methyltransferase [Synechocystis sp. PCC 7509]|uniref:class I SAM-dependent methyltransferase n=1 Tax=Synechocystis sp. PCC 7509 TaxID=927677 RepID=UPI0002AC6EC7|nr:class I SAM-dependent methyltransferase [Synechocystis sp. PCC 7509]
MNSNAQQWNASLYDSKHKFVSQLATDLVELLSPKAGERILDIGCGTGHLTQEIASYGAEVLGIDSAETMILQAKENYLNLQFAVMDATNLEFTEEFDAVFSNAVLHWIKQPEKVITGVWQSLKPKGRFVAEFGGKGNINLIQTALNNAICTEDSAFKEVVNPNYFPSIAEYGILLEKQGFELTFATLFARSTPLDGENGIGNWLKMFRNSVLVAFAEEAQTRILANVESQLRPTLYKNGTWFADYRRLRIVAIKE